MDDAGGTGPDSQDWTIFTTLRDHTHQKYYWRVANTPTWNVIDLKKVDWAYLRERKMVGNLDVQPDPEWAVDVTNDWQRS